MLPRELPRRTRRSTLATASHPRFCFRPRSLQARRSEVSDSYAKALVELADEKSKLEPVHADVDAIGSLMKDNLPLRELMYNPIITGERVSRISAPRSRRKRPCMALA